MALPVLAVPAAAAAAPWIVRMLVKYAWGPLIVAIGHMMKSRLGIFILGAFLWAGLNITTLYLILDPTITILRDLAQQAGTGGTTNLAMAAGQYMGLMKFDLAITMVISAIVSRNLVYSGGVRITRAPGIGNG
ncbi:MAG: hypothetical protein GX772_10260 [Alcaligenaceae bacterium]|nr:hypothetical protein [Alcaligenaceae bacterium]